MDLIDPTLRECISGVVAQERVKKLREHEALVARVRELEALVWHMKHTTCCAYCGFEVTLDNQDSAGVVVAEHIRTCDKHPLGERVRWLEGELLALDSRSTGYRVKAEQLAARVRELEARLGDQTAAFDKAVMEERAWCKKVVAALITEYGSELAALSYPWAPYYEEICSAIAAGTDAPDPADYAGGNLDC